MEQLTKNQAVATSQEAVQNQNEPQLRDENAHNDKSVHGVRSEERRVGKECRCRWSFGGGYTHRYFASRSASTRGAGLLVLSRLKDRASPNCVLTNSSISAFFFQEEDGIRDRSRHSC